MSLTIPSRTLGSAARQPFLVISFRFAVLRHSPVDHVAIVVCIWIERRQDERAHGVGVGLLFGSAQKTSCGFFFKCCIHIKILLLLFTAKLPTSILPYKLVSTQLFMSFAPLVSWSIGSSFTKYKFMPKGYQTTVESRSLWVP